MRLIDADAMKKSLEAWAVNLGNPKMLVKEETEILIDSAPSIKIIPCVECRYKGMEICPMYKLTKAGVLKPYDFCSYGEREGE